jgi:hypothetical protein
MRPVLHPIFKKLSDGISEFSFANIYLFRATHAYRVSALPGGLILITGVDKGRPLFMLPNGFPDERLLRGLFTSFSSMKAVSGEKAAMLARQGYSITEDRDNFDYLYSREEMVGFPGSSTGRRICQPLYGTYNYEGRPGAEYKIPRRREGGGGPHGENDYEAARRPFL